MSKKWSIVVKEMFSAFMCAFEIGEKFFRDVIFVRGSWRGKFGVPSKSVKNCYAMAFFGEKVGRGSFVCFEIGKTLPQWRF
jgi:hypothetical protein